MEPTDQNNSKTPLYQASALSDYEQCFAKNGYVVIEEMISATGLGDLREAYDRLLENQMSCGDTDRQLGGLTRQIVNVHLHDPIFADNEAIKLGGQIAGQLMGVVAPPLTFSMAIYKPPMHPHPTPWHQDMSYLGQPMTEAGVKIPNNMVVQFWLALDDVAGDMGCMEFIPGMHNQPMFEHYVAGGAPNDPGRLLAIRDPEKVMDLSTAVACPLKAGSATVHGYATPHYTAPNQSPTQGRRAFIFTFAQKAQE